jgi:transcriptional regulator with XRE-family HTH domain
MVPGTIATMVDDERSSYARRLETAMTDAKVSIEHLAKHLGVTPNAIRKLLKGRSGRMNAENNARAAAFLGVTSDWLATGEGERATAAAPLRAHVDAADQEADAAKLDELREMELIPSLARKLYELRQELADVKAAAKFLQPNKAPAAAPPSREQLLNPPKRSGRKGSGGGEE